MATRKRVTKLTSYHFAIVVHGECCARGHLWIETQRGRSVQDAVTRLLRSIRRQGYDPVEYAQLPSPTVLGTVESTPDAEKYV